MQLKTTTITTNDNNNINKDNNNNNLAGSSVVGHPLTLNRVRPLRLHQPYVLPANLNVSNICLSVQLFVDQHRESTSPFILEADYCWAEFSFFHILSNHLELGSFYKCDKFSEHTLSIKLNWINLYLSDHCWKVLLPLNTAANPLWVKLEHLNSTNNVVMEIDDLLLDMNSVTKILKRTFPFVAMSHLPSCVGDLLNSARPLQHRQRLPQGFPGHLGQYHLITQNILLDNTIIVKAGSAAVPCSETTITCFPSNFSVSKRLAHSNLHSIFWISYDISTTPLGNMADSDCYWYHVSLSVGIYLALLNESVYK